MNKFFNKVKREIKEIFPFLKNKEEKTLEKWHKDCGDSVLRLTYNLNQSSVVFDLGGYKGQWASDIFSKYLCDIYVFEPIPEFVSFIKKRFVKNPKIKVFPFGLGNSSREETFYLNYDGTSVFRKGEKSIKSGIVCISDFLKGQHIGFVDLIKINIEGGEFDLLEYCLDHNIVKRLKNIQVQFHDFVSNAVIRREHIQERLKNTHKLTYCYDFVWENWQIKS